MEALNTVIDRFMKRDRATRLEYLSWFYGGVALTLLVIGLVSPRNGEDLVLNMQHWSSPWKVVWGIATVTTLSSAGICQFMRREELSPKPGVRPWHWHELALAAVVVSVALTLIVTMNAKVLLKM